MVPALLLLEFESVAVGIAAGDAMVKQSPLADLVAGSVQPGKYLVVAGGDVASVDEARRAGVSAGDAALSDQVFLPEVASEVVAVMTGRRPAIEGEALGIVETTSVAATLEAADAAVKGARVRLSEIRLADGLGGRAYFLLTGEVADVEEGVAIAELKAGSERLVAGVVIPQIHPEMLENLSSHAEFQERIRAYKVKG